jgi:putative intracellular protease/amidase
MRILMILIPENDEPGSNHDAFVPFERAVVPYYAFQDAGFEVVLSSPDGGSPLLEAARHEQASIAIVHRFSRDKRANDEFNDTLRLDQVFADDFDAAFCVGLPGPIWRADQSGSAGALLSKLLETGKPVAVLPSGVDLVPKGAGEGLLIIGDGANAPNAAAEALMGAIRQHQIKPERKVS